MKKNLLKNFVLPLLLFMLLITKVNAAGSVPASFTGNSSVENGKTISVNVYVGTVTGGADGKVYIYGGFLSYDPQYLEFQSITGANEWSAQINSANNKIAIADYTLSKGVKNGSIGTIKFKALKTGSTNITMTSPSASDTAGDLTVTFTGKTITITEPTPVTPKSSNSKLSALGVEGFTLSPTFSSSVTSYTVEVPEDTSSVNITATKEDSKASVTGTGTKTLSGKLTTATIKVTAEDGSITNYVVNIIKESKQVTPEPEPDKPVEVKSNDSTLKKLDVSGYTLNPAFNSGVTSYTMKVTNNITGLSVTAIPNSDKAKVSISGNKNWQVGNNAILVKVTAEDGTQTVYTVNVNRADAKAKSSDTNIDLRILSTHNIEPEYSNSINDYVVMVPNDVTELKLNVTPYDKKTKVSIEGGKDLQVGVVNPVKITIKAEDGTVRTVTLNVTRSEEKANTDLLDLRVVGHTLNPVFKPIITEYKVNVSYDEDELELIIKTPEGAKAEVSGNENFKVGKNTVLIKVTDENGYVKYYEITVNKAKKKVFTIFGMTLIPFLILLLLLLALLLLLLYLLLRRKDKEKEELEVKQQDAPVNIDFKPEFNFNSNNRSGTDDDVVYSEGDLISGSDVKQLSNSKNKGEVYDMYDDVVTKDELVDAINESIETKNPDKLKMLLEQEKLNRKKEELKRKDREKFLEDKEDE